MHWGTMGIVAHRGSFGPVGVFGSGSAQATGPLSSTTEITAPAAIDFANIFQVPTRAASFATPEREVVYQRVGTPG